MLLPVWSAYLAHVHTHTQKVYVHSVFAAPANTNSRRFVFILLSFCQRHPVRSRVVVANHCTFLIGVCTLLPERKGIGFNNPVDHWDGRCV